VESFRAIRSFLCLPLGEAEKRCLLQHMKAPGVRWLSGDQLHITLHFLGDLPSEKLEELKEALRETPPEIKPLELSFSSWGVFPPGSGGRILWVGLCGEVAQLGNLHAELAKILVRCGIDVEKRSYSPHITVARAFKGGVISREAREALENAAFYGRSWKTERFLLMKSELLPRGPRYSPLESYELS